MRQKKKSRAGDSKASTAKTTATLPAKSMTLKKADLVELCEILEKAIENDTQGYLDFTLSAKRESISSESIEGLRNARLPEEVNHVSLVAASYKKDRKIRLVSYNDMSYTEVNITSADADWVAARSKEIEKFISDHHNFHWIFNRFWLPALQGVLLVGLLMYTVYIYTKPLWSNAGFMVAVALCSVFSVQAYIWGISKLFPFTFIDTGRPSTIATFRTGIKYAVPIVILGLIVQLIIKWFFA